jgi:sugar phosphate isomerase/epimerase/glycosyltransferase involved in cell wall biosynthesis
MSSNIVERGAVDPRVPDKVVMVSDWLTKNGGGVNSVMKDQIDFLARAHGIPIDVLMEGGDYEPEGPVTFVTFPDSRSPHSLCNVLPQHIECPSAQGRRIAVIIHNILTVPYSLPLNQALRRIVAEVGRDPALAGKVKFIAWTHDVFGVPHEMVPRVSYVAISEERQRRLSDYFHQSPDRFPVVVNAVNLPRMLGLSPEAGWLLNALRLYDEEFVAFYPVRMARNKNIEGAVAIVAALNRLGKRTTLIVPGMTADWERDYYNQLREQAGRLGIAEKVIFLTDLAFEGRPFVVSEVVIRDLYKLASFLLFTSRDEGFGLPLIEAGSWRLPAVISPIPSLARISEGTSTLVVDPDHEPADHIARRIMDYMGGNPVYGMQRRVFSQYNMVHQFETLGWRLPTEPHAPCRIGVQTTDYFPRRRIEDQFLDAVHNGLDAFEVFFDPQPERHLGFRPEDLKEDIRHWLRENAREYDVQFSVCARRNVRDSAERRRHWEACLAFARDIGAALLVTDLPPPEAFRPAEFDRFVQDFQGVIDPAVAAHIQVAVENGSYEGVPAAPILTTSDHLNSLFERLGKPRAAGVSFNAGRAHLFEDAANFLRKIRAPVTHVKLSDNRGPGHDEVHQRLGQGSLPLKSLLQALNERDYRGMIILEYFYADLWRDRARIEAALASDP